MLRHSKTIILVMALIFAISTGAAQAVPGEPKKKRPSPSGQMVAASQYGQEFESDSGGDGQPGCGLRRACPEIY